jgi:hypothetical protein
VAAHFSRIFGYNRLSQRGGKHEFHEHLDFHRSYQAGAGLMDWLGEEMPGLNCQEASQDRLLKALREILLEAIEMNRNDVLDSPGRSYEKRENRGSPPIYFS